MNSAKRIHTCRVCVTVQQLELVLHEWLLPIQGKSKLTPKGHDCGVQKQITEENQVPAFVRSIMRSSKSVQVSCDLEETILTTGIQDFTSSCMVSH